MVTLDIGGDLIITRVFIPEQLGGDDVVHYYLNKNKGVIQGLERLTELSPIQVMSIAKKQGKEGQQFLKEVLK